MRIVIKDKESLCKYFRLKEAKETWELNVYVYEYYTATQKRMKSLPFCNSMMDLEGAMLSKISQTEIDNGKWQLYMYSTVVLSENVPIELTLK